LFVVESDNFQECHPSSPLPQRFDGQLTLVSHKVNLRHKKSTAAALQMPKVEAGRPKVKHEQKTGFERAGSAILGSAVDGIFIRTLITAPDCLSMPLWVGENAESRSLVPFDSSFCCFRKLLPFHILQSQENGSLVSEALFRSAAFGLRNGEIIVIHHRENCDFQQEIDGPPNMLARQLKTLSQRDEKGCLELPFGTPSSRERENYRLEIAFHCGILRLSPSFSNVY
jgi:hypothetical protein